MENFGKKLSEGKGAERLIGEIFTKKGMKVDYAPEGWFTDWDMVVEGQTVEVKWDQQAHRTGNIFIETSFKGKPGGINSTKAKWFCIVTDVTIFLCLTEELKCFLTTPIEGARFIKAGDGKMSEGWLIPVRSLKTKWIPSLRGRAR